MELTHRAGIVFASENEHDFVDGIHYEQAPYPIRAANPLGAGDAFVAGYRSAMLDGLGPAERLRRGALLGACAAASHSDWQGLPTRDELGFIDAGDGTIIR